MESTNKNLTQHFKKELLKCLEINEYSLNRLECLISEIKSIAIRIRNELHQV